MGERERERERKREKTLPSNPRITARVVVISSPFKAAAFDTQVNHDSSRK